MTVAEILEILRHPEGLDWSLQGFGLLRLYLDETRTARLHVWDEAEAIEGVTRVHDHPWDLDSRIVSGHLTNQRYTHVAWEAEWEPWTAWKIKPGEDAKLLAPVAMKRLQRLPTEHYGPGETYHQDAPEIHESVPSRGCVTVATRTNRLERDEAIVFTRSGGCWVDAAPRPATPDEVLRMTRLALERWGD